MELATVVDELYGLPLDTFTARRDELAKEARAARDRDLAKVIGKLRKPSVAAWAINIAARAAPEDVATVLDLGDALQVAQGGGAGDLRELLGRRQGAIAAAVQRIRAEASTRAQMLSDSAAGEVEQTLRAAMADPDVAGLVRRGQLTSAITASVLGGFDLAAIAAAPNLASAPSPPPPAQAEDPPTRTRAEAPAPDQDSAPSTRSSEAERRVRDAEGDVAAADQAVTAARSDLKRADREVADLRALRDDLHDRLAEAEGRLATASSTREEAANRLESAELTAADARADAHAAQRDLAAARGSS